LKRILLSLAAICILALPSVAQADTLTFIPTPADLNDLDHHQAYTWRLNVNLNGQNLTGARVTFQNINSDGVEGNRLFVHLLDTAKFAGVASFTDEVDFGSIIDDFVSTRYHNQAAWLVANGTADTFLVSQTFTTSSSNFVYDFTASQLAALGAYIANGGNIALGFDPDCLASDCHFFNDQVKLEMFTESNAVPEPTTITLLATGLAVAYFRKRKSRKNLSSGT
jgi:hypothetical protein